MDEKPQEYQGNMLNGKNNSIIWIDITTFNLSLQRYIQTKY